MTDTTEFETALTIDGTPVNVLRLELRDAVDEVGWLRCELEDGSGGPDPGTLVGKPLSLTVSHRSRGQSCTFAGYVVEADATTGGAEAERGTRIVASPRLFRLTQRASSPRLPRHARRRDIAHEGAGGGGRPRDGAQKWKITGSVSKARPTRRSTARRISNSCYRVCSAKRGSLRRSTRAPAKDVITFFDTDLGDVEGEKAIPHRFMDGLNTSFDSGEPAHPREVDGARQGEPARLRLRAAQSST
jgi:type VI secretion system secreted protein VgrG